MTAMANLPADQHCAHGFYFPGGCLYCANQEIARLKAEHAWQPIETAPAGVRSILWFRELGYPVVGWPEAYGYKTGGWKPTHWMPAPAGPASDVSESEPLTPVFECIHCHKKFLTLEVGLDHEEHCPPRPSGTRPPAHD
jgi:hypothetical protein